MSPVTLAPPQTRTVFTIRGADPVAVEVDGTLDAGAGVGFLAVADWLVGSRFVTFDLSGCDPLDELGDRILRRVVGRITAAGGIVEVRS